MLRHDSPTINLWSRCMAFLFCRSDLLAAGYFKLAIQYETTNDRGHRAALERQADFQCGLCTIKPHKIFLSESLPGPHLQLLLPHHFVCLFLPFNLNINDRPWRPRPLPTLQARPLHRLNSPKAGTSRPWPSKTISSHRQAPAMGRRPKAVVLRPANDRQVTMGNSHRADPPNTIHDTIDRRRTVAGATSAQ